MRSSTTTNNNVTLIGLRTPASMSLGLGAGDDYETFSTNSFAHAPCRTAPCSLAGSFANSTTNNNTWMAQRQYERATGTALLLHPTDGGHADPNMTFLGIRSTSPVPFGASMVHCGGPASDSPAGATTKPAKKAEQPGSGFFIRTVGAAELDDSMVPVDLNRTAAPASQETSPEMAPVRGLSKLIPSFFRSKSGATSRSRTPVPAEEGRDLSPLPASTEASKAVPRVESGAGITPRADDSPGDASSDASSDKSGAVAAAAEVVDKSPEPQPRGKLVRGAAAGQIAHVGFMRTGFDTVIESAKETNTARAEAESEREYSRFRGRVPPALRGSQPLTAAYGSTSDSRYESLQEKRRARENIRFHNSAAEQKRAQEDGEELTAEEQTMLERVRNERRQLSRQEMAEAHDNVFDLRNGFLFANDVDPTYTIFGPRARKEQPTAQLRRIEIPMPGRPPQPPQPRSYSAPPASPLAPHPTAATPANGNRGSSGGPRNCGASTGADDQSYTHTFNKTSGSPTNKRKPHYSGKVIMGKNANDTMTMTSATAPRNADDMPRMFCNDIDPTYHL